MFQAKLRRKTAIASTNVLWQMGSIVQPNSFLHSFFLFQTRAQTYASSDKTQSLCLLSCSTSWRESHLCPCPILFRGPGFLSRTRQSTLSSFAFSQFRECVFYALIMHYQINRHVKCILDGCSMSSGMLFQLNWNTVPTYLEQGSILAVTRLEPKKLTT